MASKRSWERKGAGASDCGVTRQGLGLRRLVSFQGAASEISNHYVLKIVSTHSQFSRYFASMFAEGWNFVASPASGPTKQKVSPEELVPFPVDLWLPRQSTCTFKLGTCFQRQETLVLPSTELFQAI